MPLVIVVLAFIVIILNRNDSKKRNDKSASLNEDYRRKTNARLERQVMDAYMKHGYSADEAFRRSYEDMIAAEYDPCIPRDAYGSNSSCCSELGRGDENRFDSFWVKQRREAAIQAWLYNNPGKIACNAPRDEIDAIVYDNFPKTEGEYLYDIKRISARSKAEPIGTFIIYPRLGTCEVLAHNWTGTSGTYTLKVLRTGQIVNYVRIGDEQIRRQGSG